MEPICFLVSKVYKNKIKHFFSSFKNIISLIIIAFLLFPSDFMDYQNIGKDILRADLFMAITCVLFLVIGIVYCSYFIAKKTTMLPEDSHYMRILPIKSKYITFYFLGKQSFLMLTRSLLFLFVLNTQIISLGVNGYNSVKLNACAIISILYIFVFGMVLERLKEKKVLIYLFIIFSCICIVFSLFCLFELKNLSVKNIYFLPILGWIWGLFFDKNFIFYCLVLIVTIVASVCFLIKKFKTHDYTSDTAVDFTKFKENKKYRIKYLVSKQMIESRRKSKSLFLEVGCLVVSIILSVFCVGFMKTKDLNGVYLPTDKIINVFACIVPLIINLIFSTENTIDYELSKIYFKLMPRFSYEKMIFLTGTLFVKQVLWTSSVLSVVSLIGKSDFFDLFLNIAKTLILIAIFCVVDVFFIRVYGKEDYVSSKIVSILKISFKVFLWTLNLLFALLGCLNVSSIQIMSVISLIIDVVVFIMLFYASKKVLD